MWGKVLIPRCKTKIFVRVFWKFAKICNWTNFLLEALINIWTLKKRCALAARTEAKQTQKL